MHAIACPKERYIARPFLLMATVFLFPHMNLWTAISVSYDMPVVYIRYALGAAVDVFFS